MNLRSAKRTVELIAKYEIGIPINSNTVKNNLAHVWLITSYMYVLLLASGPKINKYSPLHKDEPGCNLELIATILSRHFQSLNQKACFPLISEGNYPEILKNKNKVNDVKVVPFYWLYCIYSEVCLQLFAAADLIKFMVFGCFQLHSFCIENCEGLGKRAWHTEPWYRS